jgi:acyl carrier protein
MITKEDAISFIIKLISEETGISSGEINETDTFFNLGLDSVSCIFLMDKLEKKMLIELNPIHFWDYPSIDTYADFLVLHFQQKDGN